MEDFDERVEQDSGSMLENSTRFVKAVLSLGEGLGIADLCKTSLELGMGELDSVDHSRLILIL